MSLLGILITYMFVSNLILTQFLGLCPFIGVSRNTEAAVGMGFAVTFVMAIASLTTWAIRNFILLPLDLEFLQTVSFILVIASLVQLVEMVIQKASPPLYRGLGIYLPLITTNCAVMGIALFAARSNYGGLESFVAGISGGLGFLLAIVSMSAIREKLELEWVPRPLRGVPIAFVTGGLMALAFMAFDKALLNNLVG